MPDVNVLEAATATAAANRVFTRNINKKRYLIGLLVKNEQILSLNAAKSLTLSTYSNAFSLQSDNWTRFDWQPVDEDMYDEIVM